MRRIGVMGGTFDPVHEGHIILASQAKAAFCLDEVWFMPSNNPPHKVGKGITPVEHRLSMLNEAINDIDRFSVSDFELHRDGLTYSSDTFKALKEMFPEDRFFLIMGGDSILQFENWHKPDEIVKYADIIASGRAGYSNGGVMQKIKDLSETLGATIFYLDAPSMDISSSEIRERISLGFETFGLLPDGVRSYIKSHGLYEDSEISNLLKVLEKELPKKRFVHTLGVALTAYSLAGCHGADKRTAYLAGLLHDNAKAIDYDDQLAVARSLGLELTETEINNPGALIHAKLGAYYAEHRFGIKDADVLNAILYHTTGRKEMSVLEKIIYVADYIEPGRTMTTSPCLSVIRCIAREDLDKAVYLEMENLVQYLNKSNGDVDPDTIQTYEYYKRIVLG